MTKRYSLTWVLALTIVISWPAWAATVGYEYDALGRLTHVIYSDGSVVIYKLDPAGNRTQVLSGTLPGVPSSISVPSSSSSGSYSISWGSATGTVTAYKLFEATNSSFSGQTLAYSGTALSTSISGKGDGTYYYRVEACFDTECSAYRTGSNGVTVTIPQTSIQVLDPSISVGPTGQVTQITTLANLNGHSATIYSFSVSCTKASATIQSGGQSVIWTNSNTYLLHCDIGRNQQCSASYAIRDSGTGQQYPGTASITVVAQGQSLPPGQSCP